MNKIEILSKESKKVIFDYNNVQEINDDIIQLAKVESVLNERPTVMAQDVLAKALKTFDEYFLLKVNGKDI